MKQKKKSLNFMHIYTKMYLFLMCGIFPFFYLNNYIDITYSKKNFFQIMSVPLIVLGLIFILVSLKKQIAEKSIKFSITDIFALIFMVTVLISCIISPHRKEAFLGQSGRQLGGIYLIICVMVYFVISRFYSSFGTIFWVIVIANSLHFILVISNFLGFDPLGMYTNLAAHQHNFFLGTMGNININAGYTSLITAFVMTLYYFSKKEFSKKMYLSFIPLGIFTCFCTRSDSWLLVIGTTFLILLAHAMNSKEKLWKCFEFYGCFVFSGIIMKVLELFEKHTSWSNIWIDDLRSRSLQYTLISGKFILLEIIILIIFYIAIKSKFSVFLEKYGRKILAGCVIAVIIAGLIIILPLEDSFGTNRGYIWKRTLMNFSDYSLSQKIFGYGPNCFLQSMEANYGAEMRELYGSPFIDAHNEILQFLAVTGILGAISYAGMQISLLIKCIKKKNSDIAIIGIVILASYFLQGLVNNPQVFTTPLLFIFLGVIENRIND